MFKLWNYERSYTMKKYVTLALVILTVSIIISATGVQAYLSPAGTTLSGIELKPDKSKYTSPRRTKNVEIYQQYYHTGSTTLWSPDCEDCIVSTDLYMEMSGKDTKISSITTVKGNLKNMEDSFLTGNYFVKLWRVNPGLLTTTHTGTWYINVNR